jgi:large subunit ribosomal protein L24
MSKPKMKIRKGDTVVVNTGKNKGKSGEVLKVMPEKSRVIVQGVNVVKKHNKPTQISPGGIEEKELPIHVSNVSLADPKDSDKGTRVGYKTLENGTKVRVARRSGETIDNK